MTKTERASEGKTEYHQLSKKAIGNHPSLSPSQYCKMGPSTKVGTETPSTAITTAAYPSKVLCRRAATMPSTIPYHEPEDDGLYPDEGGDRRALQDHLRHGAALEVERVAQVPLRHVGHVFGVLDV